MRLSANLQRIICCGTLLMSLLPAVVRAQTLPEYGIKAGLLYTFMRYTTWPDSVGDKLNLCIYGNSPFGSYLDDVDRKKIDDREVSIQTIQVDKNLDDCHVVYFPAGVSRSIESAVQNLSGQPTLTISDASRAILYGVHIYMYRIDERVAFDVNLKSLRRNQIQLSSRVLRLATQIAE